MDRTSQYRIREHSLAMIVGGGMLLLSWGCCQPEQTVSPGDADELLLAVAYGPRVQAKEALWEIAKTRSELKYIYAFLTAYRRDDLNRAWVVTTFGDWLEASQHTPELLVEGWRGASAQAWALREEVRSPVHAFAEHEFDVRSGRTSVQAVVPNGLPHLFGTIATGGGIMSDYGFFVHLNEKVEDTSVRELVRAVEEHSGRKIEWSGPLPEGFLDWGVSTSRAAHVLIDQVSRLEVALRKLADLRARYPIWKREQEPNAPWQTQVGDGRLPTCIYIPLPGKFVFIHIPEQPEQPIPEEEPQTDDQ